MRLGGWQRRSRHPITSTRPASRPDADNYIKVALDAINTIVVTDDSLIVDLRAVKQYASVPQLTIVITPLAAFTAQGRARGDAS